jgi:hypothetical protein
MAKEWEMAFPIGGILIAPHFKASFGLLEQLLVEVIYAANVQFSM